jgi:hypothetical protein
MGNILADIVLYAIWGSAIFYAIDTSNSIIMALALITGIVHVVSMFIVNHSLNQ